MHTLTPEQLSERVQGLLDAFEEKPPKFIVDTYKIHFPWDRPPLELWPQIQNGPLPPNREAIEIYNKQYTELLMQSIDSDEALRFEAMEPLRNFVMTNYRITKSFGRNLLFERK